MVDSSIVLGRTSLQSPVSPAKPLPSDIGEAASQFEALLISQMLKEMRTSDAGSWLGGGSDSASGTMIEMAEEYLAQALTAQGGLGLGRMIASQFPGSTQPNVAVTAGGRDASADKQSARESQQAEQANLPKAGDPTTR